VRRVIQALGAALLLLAISTGGVLAGEVTGNGDPTPIKERFVAKSICAFSGLNDRTVGEGPVEPRTQNWGTIPKAARDELALEGEHPGQSCRGFPSGGH
jgi:hypothetical protein